MLNSGLQTDRLLAVATCLEQLDGIGPFASFHMDMSKAAAELSF